VAIPGPLSGVVVADSCRVRAGPYATMLLGGDEKEILAWLDGDAGTEGE